MTTISYLFTKVEDVARYYDGQAEMNESQARAADTTRSQTVANARAVAFRDAARILRESWIDEIDGDRKTSTEKGRMPAVVNAPKIPKKRRRDACPDCGASATSHTGTYCNECGHSLIA